MEMAGATIGGAAINGGLGIFGSWLNNYFASQREATARRENYEYNEMAAENADARTRALYADLQSPAALLQQYKEAELSPSLMFAGGGGQGAQPSSGAQGAGASGISPTTYGIPPLDAAEIMLKTAEARKANAEAETEEGTNERGKTEINTLIENCKNVGLKNAWQEYENSLKMLDVQFEASTFDTKIDNFINESEYLKHKVTSARVQAEIDEKTEKDIIQYMKERTLNIIADTILKHSEKQLNEAKIDLTQQQIYDILSQIVTREGTLKLGNQQLEAQVNQWAIQNGLTKREQNIQIGKIVVDGIGHSKDRLVKLIDAIIPL